MSSHLAIGALVALIAILVFNAVATLAIVRTGHYQREQKRYQIALIWLAPFVGAWLCLHVLADTRRNARPATQNNPTGETMPGTWWGGSRDAGTGAGSGD